MKLRIWVGLLSLLLILGLSMVVVANEEELADPKIPESWYEAPKTASEAGITEFQQSPMLDERVANGELPPLEDRLPEDPPVQEPYSEIGKYGGTLNIYADSFDFASSIMGCTPQSTATNYTPAPAMDYVIPWMIKGWDFADNYKEVTIHLREGLKWSDGEPLDASDYLFWWEKEFKNEALTPTSYEYVPLLEVTSEDPYTVTFRYEKPYTTFASYRMARGMTGSSNLTPEHFMQQFHKEIVGEEKVKEKMKVTGHTDWREFWRYKSDKSLYHPEREDQRPTLRAYIAVKRTAGSIIFERNPYYPFVDPEGNQLPYIDRVRLNIVSSTELITGKAVTGEADWEWNYLQEKDLPVIINNQDKGDYRTYFYPQPFAAKTNIHSNLTHKDPQMRAIFQDVRFRRALSLAINREEINDKYYLGTGVPRQQTVPSNNKYFKEEYARAYADYNPEKAKELFDEMGLIDRDEDGYREMPVGTMKTYKGEEVSLDGGKFSPILILRQSYPMPVFEMVQKHLEDVGINLRVEQLGSSLFSERVMSSNYDMHSHHKGAADVAPYAPGSTLSSFSSWSRWYASKGEAGEEPPENIKELIEWRETYRNTTDQEEKDEAVRNILEAQAENVWSIGLVGMTSQPIVVKNRVRNVLEKALYNFDLKKGGIARPIQFYIEE